MQQGTDILPCEGHRGCKIIQLGLRSLVATQKGQCLKTWAGVELSDLNSRELGKSSAMFVLQKRKITYAMRSALSSFRRRLKIVYHKPERLRLYLLSICYAYSSVISLRSPFLMRGQMAGMQLFIKQGTD